MLWTSRRHSPCGRRQQSAPGRGIEAVCPSVYAHCAMAAMIAHLACEALPAEFRTVRAHGTEAMNALPRWEVGILVEGASLSLDEAIGAPAVLSLADEQEGAVRPIGLVVTDVAYEAEGRDGHHYTVTLGAPVHFLTQRSGYRIFLGKTTKEIVEQVLADAGVARDAMVWRLAGEYPPRPHTAQYDETEWAFVARLLADDGISFWFDYNDGAGPVIVFADDAAAHDGIRGEATVPYEDASGAMRARCFYELTFTKVLAPTAVHVRDYDVRAPDVPIEGRAGEGVWEHFEYPACVPTSAAAARRARVRLEQLRRTERHVVGVTNCTRVEPGRVVRIIGCSDDWMNGELLVTGAEHDITVGSRTDADGEAYVCRAMLVPAGGAAHRPDIPRRIPRVPGFEPAATTGPAGEEIHVDDLGRVKVRFPWDRSDVTDDRSSTWVRCLQMNMGGAMLLPRVGWEVPVAYIDGNPDRPFVLGRVYNGTAVVPYGLPGASATTTLQSATSPGDGTTQEIRVGDSSGGQEMFIHATRDQTVTVGGASTSTIGANETHDVQLGHIVSIGGAQSLTVGADQTLNIGTNYVTSVKGSRSEMIGAMESIKVTANRVLAVKGAYTELVGAFYGLQCNQSNSTIKGSFTQLIGGSMSLKGGLGVSQSVAAVRTELVGGGRSIKGSRGYNESVTGAKSLTAAATTEKIGAALEVTVSAAGTVTVGASANLKASGPLVIEAPDITLDVGGKIKAKALELGGGKLKAKSGTTLIKGSIKRTGGSKIT
ncbi:type VI secretion system Vgr family protein [Sorangium sp. So ce385]|uniref:type VI secretion system Vgr family protein n=1 Tax=Sorangium sp. So ce385 TaxID=3133308 RepID=UPI003F5BBF4D